MKTSDRLLIGFLGLSLLAFTSVPLTLLIKYKNGDILSGKELLKTEYIEYKLTSAAPAFISVKGFEEVIIIPSDSFYFEMGKRFQGKSGYQLMNDTIYIVGNNREDARSFSNIEKLSGPRRQLVKDYTNRQFKVELKTPLELLKTPLELNQQKLIVYCPNSAKLRIEDGEIFLQGSIHPGKFNTVLDLSYCHLELGGSYYPNTPSNRFYYEVEIHSAKSGVSLNNGSVIHHLSISMDDRSILSDNAASLDSLTITCTSLSRFELAGKNLSKVKFENP